MDKVQVQIQNSVYRDRAVAVLTSTSGLLALLLASLGLYGVVAYSVSRRTTEIGIRMALGAQRQSIFALILREVVWMIAAGAVIGVIAGLTLTRTLASQLFAVQPTDGAVFTGAVAVLFVVALLAGAIPTLRAARVDPIRALRYD
jgi:ABC-type antimicrobial peptide transport system permease subunit